MEMPRPIFTFAALIVIFYTIYLAKSSHYAEAGTGSLRSSYASNYTPLPYCANRASLLSALGSGEGCTFKWFGAEEVCMILERFGAIIFVGDELTDGIHKSFKLLSRERERKAHGQAKPKSQDLVAVKHSACDKEQFGTQCLGHIMEAYNFDQNEDQIDHLIEFQQPLCNRIPLTYLPLSIIPTPPTDIAITQFKKLTYDRPRPWQPSPLIFSFFKGSRFNSTFTTQALDEWQSLAMGAARNIPMLFVGPTADGSGQLVDRIKSFENEIVQIAEERHFEVLSLYNLTLATAKSKSISRNKTLKEEWKRKLATVEAMMIVNWLSKLETS